MSELLGGKVQLTESGWGRVNFRCPFCPRVGQFLMLISNGSTKTKWPRKIDNYDTTEYLPTWINGRAILMESWSRFKGLEADAVIIVDTVGSADQENRSARYVSRSRAKHLLIVIEVKN
ncbi:MAG: ATP-binding domain-containing protein [bacterium]